MPSGGISAELHATGNTATSMPAGTAVGSSGSGGGGLRRLRDHFRRTVGPIRP